MTGYYYWRYRLKLAGGGELNAVTPAGEIEGALLKDPHGGHACLQPWPTLGQGTLHASLQLLGEGGDSDLLAAARRCMASDRAARSAGLGLFEGKTVPRSHLSVPDWADFAWLEEKFSAGFSIFKLKCGRNFRSEAARVDRLAAHFGAGLRLRLDFNECLDSAEFREFIALLGRQLEQVDFVEDPVPYEPETWRGLSAELPIDLAVDRASGAAQDGFAYRVVKPAWEPVPAVGRRVVITSAMDHPLGQLFAAHEAAVLNGGVDDCGLLTHWLFEPDQFSEALRVEDRRLVPPGGIGLGFTELLDALPWRKL